ncbi:MAG: response regulator [Polyangiales bacterium]
MRVALSDHLTRLRDSAQELGLSHLGRAVAEALERLERESFDPEAVRAIRLLAWRYEDLAAMHASGTRPISAETQPPVWQAISDLRAVNQARSRSEVRLDDATAVPLLTLGAPEGSDPPEVAVSLKGRQVLVVDDEPETRWFYVGVLREAGARVAEASDGLQALEASREDPPDLILSDIVMPGLDGLALCASIRREPILDGTPMILVSWRGDLRRRIQELRKELPARQIRARIAQVLEPIERFETALQGGEEARGELQDVGLAALLRMIRRRRPDVRLVLQDTLNLFEIEFRDGNPVEVTCPTVDGSVTEGRGALPSLAGMNTGRFVVAPPLDEATALGPHLGAELETAMRNLGSMLETLAEDPNCRVAFDETLLDAYLRHAPDQVRQMIARLCAGSSPCDVWESEEGSRAALDALLITLARQGVVTDVFAAPSDRPAEEVRTPMNRRRWSDGTADLSDRENLRANSAVLMHQEPVNQVSRWNEVIWRRAYPNGHGVEPGSSFALQRGFVTQLLGWGFAAVFLGTITFLGLRGAGMFAASTPPEPTEVALEAPAAVEPSAMEAPSGLSAYSGTLRRGVDESLVADGGQGALELIGPAEVVVEVDGIERGSLPVTLAVDEGRHVVRYRAGRVSGARFYYVKRGTTRTLQVSRAPGGFVDAR